MLLREREALLYVRNQLPTYLKAKGIDTDKKFRCLNPEHNDAHPSMAYDPHRRKAHCFSCGADYDTFDVFSAEYGISGAALFAKAYEYFGLSLLKGKKNTKGIVKAVNCEYITHNKHNTQYTDNTDMERYLTVCRNRLSETDYLQTRGISFATAVRFGIGYDPAFTVYEGTLRHTWRAIIIPTSDTSFTARNTDPAPKGSRIRKRGASPFFNAQILNKKKLIFIVEGELDALSIYEAGGDALALGSTANVYRFISFLEQSKPRSMLLLALDNDAEGARASKILSEALDRLNIAYRFTGITGGHKDPNDAIVASREAFVSSVNSALSLRTGDLREDYARNCAASHISDLLSNASAPISTGWPKFDEVLGGGLYDGLYVLGAMTSLGKTSFALQMCDQLAQSGHEVVFFSLEMSLRELISRSVSRHTLRDGESGGASSKNALSPRELPLAQGDAMGVVRRAMGVYASYASRVYIHEGGMGIDAASVRGEVERHLLFTGRTPVIIVDYLQILTHCDVRLSDKQNTDRAVLELKRLSRDYKTPVFVISSLNRQGYRDAVTMEAFKESGAIEYSSDVLLGMQYRGVGPGFNDEAAKAKNPSEIEVKVIKNRNGVSGKSAGFCFYGKWGYWE